MGRRFNTTLLFQSLVMVLVQVLLLDALIALRRRVEKKNDEQLHHHVLHAGGHLDPHCHSPRHHHQPNDITTTTSNSSSTITTTSAIDPTTTISTTSTSTATSTTTTTTTTSLQAYIRRIYSEFWVWEDFATYVTFLLSFSIIVSLVLVASRRAPLVVDTVGMGSAGKVEEGKGDAYDGHGRGSKALL